MNVDVTLRALADPTRRQVVERLASGACRASTLAEHCATSRPALTRHLRVLEQAALIERVVDPDDGRARRFSLVREGFEELDVWLTEVEGFWTRQLDSFAALVEGDACEP